MEFFDQLLCISDILGRFPGVPSFSISLLSQLHAKVPNKNKENLTDEGWGHTRI